jgi:hypothetical protein
MKINSKGPSLLRQTTRNYGYINKKNNCTIEFRNRHSSGHLQHFQPFFGGKCKKIKCGKMTKKKSKTSNLIHNLLIKTLTVHC